MRPRRANPKRRSILTPDRPEVLLWSLLYSRTGGCTGTVSYRIVSSSMEVVQYSTLAYVPQTVFTTQLQSGAGSLNSTLYLMGSLELYNSRVYSSCTLPPCGCTLPPRRCDKSFRSAVSAGHFGHCLVSKSCGLL
jgi:hypothetical protein